MSTWKILLLIFVIPLLASLSIFTAQTMQQKNPQPSTTVTPQALSPEAYNQIKEELLTIVSEQDPQIALSILREQATSNEAITRSCHDLVHELGHAAYEKYKNFGQAMQYQDEMCNSGYLHGIIESHFSTSQDIFTTMQTICADYNPTQFIGWECYHGVGHGLMYYTDNDLPKSVSLCEAYTDSSSRMSCINGVFMENFNVDQKIHVSKYIKTSDPLYPCREQNPDYKTHCYIYAPTYFLNLHKNAYEEALLFCKTAEKEFQSSCIAGVGSQAIKENINNPKFVESLCMQGSENETAACITGMVSLYINHFGRLTEAETLCTKLEKSNQPVCRQVIASQSVLFHE